MISQIDLTTRLQLSGCKFSDLAQRFNKDLLYGRKCVTENRTDLMLLNVYLEMLECYKVGIPEVRSHGNFQITTLTVGFTLEIFIDGVSITGVQTSVSTNRNTTMHALVGIINNYQSTYTAVINETGDLYSVDIYGPCAGGELTYTTNATGGEIELSITDLKNGVCGVEYDNCLTEDELLVVFDKISDLTNICFQPIGFTYTEN